MLKELLRPEIEELIRQKDWGVLREALAIWPAPELSDLLLSLPKADRVLFYRSLPREMAARVFSHLEPADQDDLLRDLSNEETRHLLAALHPDDRTHLLEELPAQVTQRMLDLLAPEDLREARWLLGYPEESVGRLMTPDYVAVRQDWTIDQALRHIRRAGKRSETVNRIYVVDRDWRLMDDVELRRFILAEPESRVADIMDHSYASVSAFADREEAVRVIRRYDQVALPVLDSAGVLVGIVTVDDLLARPSRWRWVAFGGCTALVVAALVIPMTVIGYWLWRGARVGESLVPDLSLVTNSLWASAKSSRAWGPTISSSRIPGYFPCSSQERKSGVQSIKSKSSRRSKSSSTSSW